MTMLEKVLPYALEILLTVFIQTYMCSNIREHAGA